MPEEISGFSTSPQSLVKSAFEEVSRRSMHDLAFLHPTMPVSVSDFTLFEGQWTGCVITPWMLSAVIFPGPDQCWPRRTVSEKLGLQLPYGTMTFTVGELEGVSQYLSCSLMSPLPKALSVEEGLRLVADCARMLLSLPLSNPDAPSMASRRSLLFGRRSVADA
ncbi:hydrogenase-2 assembly chaperone [Enterobacteriaceae bacterium G50]|nr:hydrogenase-2 assembly chaperone [Enterobacteriaceae bacterium G50]